MTPRTCQKGRAGGGGGRGALGCFSHSSKEVVSKTKEKSDTISPSHCMEPTLMGTDSKHSQALVTWNVLANGPFCLEDFSKHATQPKRHKEKTNKSDYKT